MYFKGSEDMINPWVSYAYCHFPGNSLSYIKALTISYTVCFYIFMSSKKKKVGCFLFIQYLKYRIKRNVQILKAEIEREKNGKNDHILSLLNVNINCLVAI